MPHVVVMGAGCPYAPGASGNVATEDVVSTCRMPPRVDALMAKMLVLVVMTVMTAHVCTAAVWWHRLTTICVAYATPSWLIPPDACA